jgi:hypothetical protein
MILEAAASVGTKRGGAGIGPDVRAPAPALAKVDVVDVRGGAVLEQGQQLVLGAIEERLPMPALVLVQTIRLRGLSPSLTAAE